MTRRAIHPVQHAVDVAAAAVPAACGGWAAAKIAPLMGVSAPAAVAAAGLSLFGVAYLVMRRVDAPREGFTVTPFVPPAMDDDSLPGFLMTSATAVEEEDDALLLDSPYDADEELLLDQPFVAKAVDDLAELLLDDPLAAPPPDSRVVRLFAPQPLPTAGQLAQRIDRHLGHAPTEPVGALDDGQDALREALEELRRSLRA